MSAPTTSPFLLLLAGPSGAGKSSVLHPVVEADPRIHFSVSCTTRPRRSNEVDGVDYHFLSEEVFHEAREAGEFVEWAKVHDHFYGTRQADLQAALDRGEIPLLEIDVQGGRQIMDRFGKQLVSVFLFPPSIELLETRLRGRGTEDEAALQRRIANAHAELRACDSYDYWILNDDLEAAIAQLAAIVTAESCKRDRWAAPPTRGA
jgi:guanylate kinase